MLFLNKVSGCSLTVACLKLATLRKAPPLCCCCTPQGTQPTGQATGSTDPGNKQHTLLVILGNVRVCMPSPWPLFAMTPLSGILSSRQSCNPCGPDSFELPQPPKFGLPTACGRRDSTARCHTCIQTGTCGQMPLTNDQQCEANGAMQTDHHFEPPAC
jgi:hypothetical protein